MTFAVPFSLVLLLQGLMGHMTQVELWDESLAVGRVTNMDAFMNIRLGPTTFTDRAGRTSQLEGLFIAGRSVRYVHIPYDVDIRAAIEGQLQLLRHVRSFRGRDKGSKEFLHQKDK
ncbi:U7 snRNA-associated Sm-like protein LSm10 [Anolis sagrei]|uniref:U7 snRNA-associated Sm-like protein LSm10 n=1 Tax=Anolis sagrei TaxID=38937 RepID=UPI0035214BE0